MFTELLLVNFFIYFFNDLFFIKKFVFHAELVYTFGT